MASQSLVRTSGRLVPARAEPGLPGAMKTRSTAGLFSPPTPGRARGRAAHDQDFHDVIRPFPAAPARRRRPRDSPARSGRSPHKSLGPLSEIGIGFFHCTYPATIVLQMPPGNSTLSLAFGPSPSRPMTSRGRTGGERRAPAHGGTRNLLRFSRGPSARRPRDLRKRGRRRRTSAGRSRTGFPVPPPVPADLGKEPRQSPDPPCQKRRRSVAAERRTSSRARSAPRRRGGAPPPSPPRPGRRRRAASVPPPGRPRRPRRTPAPWRCARSAAAPGPPSRPSDRHRSAAPPR